MTRTVHVLVCEICGAKRLSSKNPDGRHAPKRCSPCNVERSRTALSYMMGKPVREVLERRKVR